MDKPKLSFSQIINMNVGFWIQYSFAYNKVVNPIYDMLGAAPDNPQLLNFWLVRWTGWFFDSAYHWCLSTAHGVSVLGEENFFFIGATFLQHLPFVLYPFSSCLDGSRITWVLELQLKYSRWSLTERWLLTFYWSSNIPKAFWHKVSHRFGIIRYQSSLFVFKSISASLAHFPIGSNASSF